MLSNSVLGWEGTGAWPGWKGGGVSPGTPDTEPVSTTPVPDHAGCWTGCSWFDRVHSGVELTADVGPW